MADPTKTADIGGFRYLDVGGLTFAIPKDAWGVTKRGDLGRRVSPRAEERTSLSFGPVPGRSVHDENSCGDVMLPTVDFPLDEADGYATWVGANVPDNVEMSEPFRLPILRGMPQVQKAQNLRMGIEAQRKSGDEGLELFVTPQAKEKEVRIVKKSVIHTGNVPHPRCSRSGFSAGCVVIENGRLDDRYERDNHSISKTLRTVGNPT